jgi:hypothetical protein
MDWLDDVLGVLLDLPWRAALVLADIGAAAFGIWWLVAS